MQYRVEIYTADTNQALMVLNNPPATPNVGDVLPGREDKVYQVIQRAFIVAENNGPTLLVKNKKPEPILVIQCIATEVNMHQEIPEITEEEVKPNAE